MTDSEVIRIQREAIAKYCGSNRKLALKIIQELGLEMREWVEARGAEPVSSDELYELIKSSAGCWPET